MPPRGPVRLTVAFGPSRSPNLPRAVALARSISEIRGISEISEISAGRWWLVKVVDDRSRDLGALGRLLALVGGWRSTEVLVDGDPEPASAVAAMAWCARDWLRAVGACGERFPLGRPWPKCFSCPLFDRERAGLEMPDRIPDGWSDQSG